MNTRDIHRTLRRATPLLASLALHTASTSAFAQPPATAPTGDLQPVSPPPPPEPPPSPPPTTSSWSDLFHGNDVLFLQRLPATAFPDDRRRGLYGGSLWSEFTDLQWPYYPRTGIGVSGYTWIDSGYEHIDRGSTTEQGTKYWLQQGRFVLRFTPTWSDGNYFIQGQAELVANKDQSQSQPNTVDTDDMWIKAGKWKSWDVQVGRYQGWEVYHFGMGLDLYTLERNGATDLQYSVPSIYGVTYAYYRPAGVGQAALHLYPTDFFRMELGTQFGNEFGENTLAVRPVGVLDFGPKPEETGTTVRLRIKAGAEWKNLSGQADAAKDFTNERGAGGSVQLIVDPLFECGVNGAYGLVDHTAQDGTVDETGSYTVYSLGGFANVRVKGDFMLGAGYNYTHLQDIHYDSMLARDDIFGHSQAFVAAQYIIEKRLIVKLVGAYALGIFKPNFGSPVFDDTMLSARLRLQYLF
jgi:hypothetical protein